MLRSPYRDNKPLIDPEALDRRRSYAAADVHYPATGGASAALALANDARFEAVVAEYVAHLEQVAPYCPGKFFVRELPALRAVLASADWFDLLIIDGYVDLDPSGRPGLGAYVHDEFGIPVIGVAKTAFRSASHAAMVRRGAATRPLHVTAAGIKLSDAAGIVERMAGPYRLPDALRRVDALARMG